MGLLDIVKKQEVEDVNKLNLVELECLLSMMKVTTFKGEQIELIYNMIVKLQNQYLALNKVK